VNIADQKNDIETARQKIAKATNCVSFSGAGLSAESGIATFRDKNEGGLWSQYDPTKLASQQGFQSDPKLVTDWYNWRRKTLAGAKANDAHHALGSQTDWVHITQNVDGLLEEGGAPPENVLHLHGSLLSDHCNARCGYTEIIDIQEPAELRHCPDCGAYLRPAVVWFGESLPEAIFEAAIQATQQADLFLVVGTSAQVAPASGLIDLAQENGAEVIVVNTEPSSIVLHDGIELIGKAGSILPKLFHS